MYCLRCGSIYEDSLYQCPECGEINRSRHTDHGSPKTIEELKRWYQDRKFPPAETTRFFIGTDYKNPRAFGIYKDTNSGEFIVYKNKDTGERVIRYKGWDEAYAVNVLWQRLKDEITNQNNQKKKDGITLGSGSIIAFIAFLLIVSGIPCIYDIERNWHNGYYTYNEDLYYLAGKSWYAYDIEQDNWDRTTEPDGYDKYDTDSHFLRNTYSSSINSDLYVEAFSDAAKSTVYRVDH